MSTFQIYWILKLDEIQGLFVFVAFCSGIAAFFLFLFASLESSQKLFEVGKRSLIACLIVLPFAILIPTTKQAAVMIVAPKILALEGIEELPEELVQLAREWIDEARPERDDDALRVPLPVREMHERRNG